MTEPGASEAHEAPAPPPAAPRGGRSAARIVRDYAETLLVAVLVVLFATTFAVQNSVIPSASMEDTLLVGDYLLVNKIVFSPMDASSPSPWLGMRPLARGDIIVFKHPDDPRTDYIKRVMGLPGDRIEVREKAVYRNGTRLLEPQAVHRTGIVYPRGSADGNRDNFGPVTVPDGMLFVMGDNRDYSRDSREFGFVPRDHVTGRAFLVFWSKAQRPGAFRRPGLAGVRESLLALRTLPRDVRWSRLFTVVR